MINNDQILEYPFPKVNSQFQMYHKHIIFK